MQPSGKLWNFLAVQVALGLWLESQGTARLPLSYGQGGNSLGETAMGKRKCLIFLVVRWNLMPGPLPTLWL